VKGSNQASRSTARQSRKSAAEKLIEILERENASLQRQNAKLLRMVEMVMEERFYRPVVTGGIRENVQTSALPLEALNDVTVFDETADGAMSDDQNASFAHELRNIEAEHMDWRKQKGLADEDAAVSADA